MSVVTSYEETGPCLKKLTIEVPVEAVEAEMKRVVRSFSKNVKMPGFRQGKVPASVVQKRFGEEIKQEVVDRLLPDYWQKAQAEKELDPLLPPRFEGLELEPGQPMTLVALVETRPEINLGELGDFDLPKGDADLSDDELDEALGDLQRHHATWTTVDRPAAHGDLVIGELIDITEDDAVAADGGDTAADEAAADDETADGESSDDKAGPKSRTEPLYAELGASGVDEELTLALTGRSAGQTAEVTRTVGDAERQFRAEIREVQEQDLPELDDEFAAKFSLDSIADLRDGVAQDLKRSKAQKLRAEREKSLLEQLRERHPIELPAGVIEKENERMLQDYAERIHAQGVDIEQAGIDWKALAGQLTPEAERRVHDRLLLDAVVAAEAVELQADELERFLSMIAAQQNQPTHQLRQQLTESGRLEPLKAQMLREKAVRHLLGEDESEASEVATDSEDDA